MKNSYRGCIVLISIIFTNYTLPMSYLRNFSNRIAREVAKPSSAQQIPKKKQPVVQIPYSGYSSERPQIPTIQTQTPLEQQPKTGWYARLMGFFGIKTTAATKPIIQQPAVPSLEKKQIKEQENINEFKKAIIEATRFYGSNIYDMDRINAINNVRQLIQKNPIYINIPIAFKSSSLREALKQPLHSITILHYLLRTIFGSEYLERKWEMISQYKLETRQPDVWLAEIALIKEILALGGNLGDNAQEALFELLKRKAIVQELMPHIYAQYFENNINNFLEQIAGIHGLNYRALEKEAHKTVAQYIFEEKTKKTRAYNALKDLLGVAEVPTTWYQIGKILRTKGLVRAPLKQSEFVKGHMILSDEIAETGVRSIVDKEAVDILKNFRNTHLHDTKYYNINDSIRTLFEDYFIDGEKYSFKNRWTYTESPKLIAPPPLSEAYRILGVDRRAPLDVIAAQYTKLLEENDPRYEMDPVKKQEKQAISEELTRAFEAIETDRMEKLKQMQQELEQQRYDQREPWAMSSEF